MTDDRARRIRETRRRFRPNGGTTEEPSDEDDTEEEAADEKPTNGSEEPSSAEETEADSQPADDAPRGDEESEDGTDSGTEREEPSPRTESAGGSGSTGSEPAEEPPESQPSADTEVTYDESDVSEGGTAEPTAGDASVGSPEGTAGADSGAETLDVPEIDDSLEGEPTVDASAIARQDDTYDQTVVGDDRDSFVDNDALARSAHRDEDTVQVLEFFLNDDRYAVEIEQISAIVEMKDITRFPRGPEVIDGVTDLRGEITAILDPTAMLDVERSDPSEEHYIVVLKRSEDKQKLGIRVTDVSQAVTYHDSQIDETGSAMSDGGVADGGNVGETGVKDRSASHEFVKGIIKKTEDGETSLVAWIDVDEIVAQIE